MKLEKEYFVYILECKDKSFYTGITTDLERRVEEHNFSDKGAKYTKMRRPVKLIYSEKKKNKSEALKREFEIKKLKKIDKEKLTR
jgi:putative endonuclease